MAANASILDGKGLATPRGRSGVGRPRDSAPPLIAINHSQRLVAHRAGFTPTVVPVIFFNARSKSITARAVPTGAALVTEATGEKETSAVPEFAVRMQVRDSELDQYSVVNNSVYNHYLQHARHEWLQHVGGDPDAVARSGDALALSALNISYRQPLRSRDKFLATVSVDRVTGARVFLRQQIRRTAPTTNGGVEEGLVLEAEAVVVWLDGEYRPKRIPKHMINKIK